MKKNKLIQENIFLTLAKVMARLSMDKRLTKIPTPEMKDALTRINISTKNRDKLLKDYCKVHPTDDRCKGIGRSK